MEVAREAAWAVAIGGCHVAVSRSSKEAAMEAQTSDQKSGRGGQQRMSHHNLDSSFCLQSFYSGLIVQPPPQFHISPSGRNTFQSFMLLKKFLW